MRVKLLFFAQLAERFGTGERTADFAEGTRVADVARAAGFGSLPVLFAVNEDFVEADYALGENDTLAFLMPASGGA